MHWGGSGGHYSRGEGNWGRPWRKGGYREPAVIMWTGGRELQVLGRGSYFWRFWGSLRKRNPRTRTDRNHRGGKTDSLGVETTLRRMKGERNALSRRWGGRS